MKSKSKSALRSALTLLAVLIVGAALIVMLLSFFDNSLNGVLSNWFAKNYMMKYYDQTASTSYIEPDWIAIKGLALRLSLAAFAIFVIAVAFVSRLRVNAERRSIGNAVGQFMLSDTPDGSLPNEIAVPRSNAKVELMRSQRLLQEETARKNNLVMYLAHDLKTPLASVIGYLTLLHDEQQISPELREKYLSITLDKAQRLEDLINEFSRSRALISRRLRLIIQALTLCACSSSSGSSSCPCSGKNRLPAHCARPKRCLCAATPAKYSAFLIIFCAMRCSTAIPALRS